MKAYLKAAGFAAVLAALPVASASAELVTNGGFETSDFTGWTVVDSSNNSDVTDSPVHGGTYAGEFGPSDGAGTAEQTLATTAGQSYSLSFWLSNGNAVPNLFEVAIDGALLGSLTDQGALSFTQYVFDFVAAGSSTQLLFTFEQPGSFWWLDDVSVTETRTTTPSPEPASIALLGAGLAGFGAMRKKRRA